MAEIVQVQAQDRRISAIIPNVTVGEDMLDEAVGTEHPVEQGAVIGDHIYDRPAALRLRYGWSLSDPRAGGDPNYLQQIYGDLLTLQSSHQLFDVITGKRSFLNMYMSSLAVHVDNESENALIVEITCREMILVQTQVISVPPRAVQAQPQQTAPTEDRGQQQPQTSLLYNLIS